MLRLAYVKVSLQGGLKTPLCEAVKVKPGLPWRCQDVRDARVMESLLRRAANREWNQPKTKKSTKQKGVGGLKNISTSKMEVQSLEFAQLVFGLALVQYFLTMLPSLCFGVVTYILGHFMLEVCDLLFYFDFTGEQS